jgi:hypothetical protein
VCRNAGATTPSPVARHRHPARSRARSEVRLAGDMICRPFAPDGDFRHVPSLGQLEARICHSVVIGEEAQQGVHASFWRGIRKPRVRYPQTRSAVRRISLVGWMSRDCAGVAGKSRRALRACELFTAISRIACPKRHAGVEFYGIKQLALDL